MFVHEGLSGLREFSPEPSADALIQIKLRPAHCGGVEHTPAGKAVIRWQKSTRRRVITGTPELTFANLVAGAWMPIPAPA
jgi:hypothetical protein